MIRLRTLGAVELRRADGTEIDAVAAQPKRLALLVYLAAARPRGYHRRDTLIGMFWPESAEARARGALGQALYFLRRSLGTDVVIGRGPEEVGIAPTGLWCDASAVHDAFEAGEVERALELYRGDLLPGFFLPDSRAFEEWLDRERAALRRSVVDQAKARAAALERDDARAAADLLRRALEIAPEDEDAVRRLMLLLAGSGDRAAALAAFDAIARRLRAEFDIAPSPETTALRAAIVSGAEPRRWTPPPTRREPEAQRSVPHEPASTTTAEPAAITRDAALQEAPGSAPRRAAVRFSRKRAAAVALTVPALAAVASLWLRSPADNRGATAGEITLAVAPFTAATADTGLQRIARELVVPLSANLDGLGDIRTVEGVEVLASARAGAAADSAVRLARQLGATRVLYGAIVATAEGLRADATLRSATEGRTIVRATARSDHDVSALADSLTWAVLTELWKDRASAAEAARVSPPEPGPPALATRSLSALRAYWDGERALAQTRYADAAASFERAFTIDSTYWFAYWRYAYTRFSIELPVDATISSAYTSHRFDFPERDRLVIEARMADSLSQRVDRLREITRRFPDFWLGWWELANRLVHDGPLLGWTHDDARVALERTLALRPNDVLVLQHLFWMAAQDVDVATMDRVVRRTHQLRAASRDYQAARPDYLVFFEMILAAARADPVALDATIDANITHLIETVPGVAGDQFSMGLSSYGYHAAGVEFGRRMVESSASAGLKGAQRRSLALAWAARGAWDSALVAARRYADAVDGPVPLQHMLRLTAAGEWLGSLPAGSADPWRDALRAHERRLDAPHRAELAWIDGVLASARARPDLLAEARRRLHQLAGDGASSPTRLPLPRADARSSADVARVLDASLHGFELALRGDSLRAGQHLADIERQRAERGWTRSPAPLHPYLTSMDRLAAARWLRQAGRPGEAERLLAWCEAVEIPGYLVSEATALVSARAFYERALAAEAEGRMAVARRHYTQFLRRYDAPMPHELELVERARRFNREASER